MFRVWGKLFKENRLIRDITICSDEKEPRTRKVFHALEEICHAFDLGSPIWLNSNIQEFKRHARTRFRQDSFVDDIDFDYLDFHVIEEDDSALTPDADTHNSSDKSELLCASDH